MMSLNFKIPKNLIKLGSTINVKVNYKSYNMLLT